MSRTIFEEQVQERFAGDLDGGLTITVTRHPHPGQPPFFTLEGPVLLGLSEVDGLIDALTCAKAAAERFMAEAAA
jgi:hypothetical protein